MRIIQILFIFFCLCFLSLPAQNRQFTIQVETDDCLKLLNEKLQKRQLGNYSFKKKPSINKNENHFYSIYLNKKKEANLFQYLENSDCIKSLEEVPKTTFASENVPNDTLYPLQWNLSFIDANIAWATRFQQDTILIGIVDSGTDFTHPDLQNFYTNIMDPVNGLDDDNNGYIDDFRGWDFGMEDNDAQIVEGIGLDHGVQMTSLSAAPTNNLHGIASAGRIVQYLPIKITNDQGSIGDPYEGVAYAIQMGCDIVNCSWTQNLLTNYAKSVIEMASENNILIVAAAGNFDNENPTYPCAHDDVLCVGAIDEQGNKTSSSSFGEWIDIASPGINLWAAKPNGSYSTTGGTSGACAFTSGAASWLVSVYPNESSAKIKERILLGAKEHIGLSNEHQNKLGEGALNLYSAQEQGNSNFSNLITWPNPSNGDFHIQFRLKKMQTYDLRILDLRGRELMKEKLDNLQIGENQLNLNIRLQSGAYFLVLNGGNSNFLEEIIIVN